MDPLRRGESRWQALEVFSALRGEERIPESLGRNEGRHGQPRNRRGTYDVVIDVGKALGVGQGISEAHRGCDGEIGEGAKRVPLEDFPAQEASRARVGVSVRRKA